MKVNFDKKITLKLSAIILSILAGIVSIIDAARLINNAREMKHTIIMAVIDPMIFTLGHIAIVAIIFWAAILIFGILMLFLIKKESRILPIVTICLLSPAMIINIVINILSREIFWWNALAIILYAAAIVFLCMTIYSIYNPYNGISAPTRAGYTFAGWVSDDPNDTTVYSATNIIYAPNNQTYYAAWI